MASSASESVSCSAVLAFKLNDLRFPKHLYSAIENVVRRTSERVLVLIFCALFDQDAGLSHTGHWEEVQTLLTAVYAWAARVGQEQEKVLLQVDVLLKGSSMTALPDQKIKWDHLFIVEDAKDGLDSLLAFDSSMPKTVLKKEDAIDSETDSKPHDSQDFSGLPSTYPVVALGGTFDHLHSGHKILLSMGAWIADTKLIVGVTDDALLRKKSNRHLLESLTFRMERVRDFLHLFKPSLICDTVTISDVYGPTGEDPNIQALVVSRETESGAVSIAKRRSENSLPALRCFVIDVISATHHNLKDEDAEKIAQTKLSSTFIRDWLARKSSSAST